MWWVGPDPAPHLGEEEDLLGAGGGGHHDPQQPLDTVRPRDGSAPRLQDARHPRPGRRRRRPIAHPWPLGGRHIGVGGREEDANLVNAIQSIGSSVIMGRANRVPAASSGGGVEPRQLLNNVSLSD